MQQVTATSLLARRKPFEMVFLWWRRESVMCSLFSRISQVPCVLWSDKWGLYCASQIISQMFQAVTRNIQPLSVRSLEMTGTQTGLVCTSQTGYQDRTCALVKHWYQVQSTSGHERFVLLDPLKVGIDGIVWNHDSWKSEFWEHRKSGYLKSFTHFYSFFFNCSKSLAKSWEFWVFLFIRLIPK